MHKKYAREAEEAHGIDFIEWKKHLDEISRDNKIIRSNLRLEEFQREKEEKNIAKTKAKEEASTDLEFRRNQVL